MRYLSSINMIFLTFLHKDNSCEKPKSCSETFAALATHARSFPFVLPVIYSQHTSQTILEQLAKTGRGLRH